MAQFPEKKALLPRTISTLRSVVRFDDLFSDPLGKRLRHAASIDDLRRLAKRRLPKGVFDYIDGAAEDERTLANNASAFGRIEFKPRVLRDVSHVDLSTTVLGQPTKMPLVLAPTGFTRMGHPEGELAVARAAERAGIPYSLSTMATCSIEEVAAVNSTSKWFQVYVWRDRGLVKDMLERASACGYEAIMVTVDTAVLGRRDRDVRNGFTLPPRLGLRTVFDGALHPAWTWRFFTSDPIRFANVVGRADDDGSSPVELSGHVTAQFDAQLSWADIDWMRSVWPGKVTIKGIQTVDDAVLAADAGVDAVILSNHGGRQLDDAPAPVELVAPVVDAVGGRTEVICDGGVRRGSDIVKAVALGANACMVGRAYLYGLAAGGERGVDHAITLLRDGMRRTMQLMGATSIGDLSRDYLESRPRD